MFIGCGYQSMVRKRCRKSDIMLLCMFIHSKDHNGIYMYNSNRLSLEHNNTIQRNQETFKKMEIKIVSYVTYVNRYLL